MRKVEQSTAFRRDFKREIKGRYRRILDAELIAVLETLAAAAAPDARLRDHALMAEWSGYRERHIRPGLLRVARLGSHSELFSK